MALSGYWVHTAGSIGGGFAFAIGGLAIAVIGLTYSELVGALPRAGGEHVYTHRGLGATWSFFCTWALLGAYLFICLFESAALPTAIEYLLPQIRMGTVWQVQGADVDIGFVVVGISGAITMPYVNVRGIAAAAALQSIVTAGIVVAGLFLITGAVGFGSFSDAEPWFSTPAVGGVLSVLILVPALLMGFDVIPQSAEEIDLPQDQIGKMLIISVCLAVLWYISISLAVSLTLPRRELAGSVAATADAMSLAWGSETAGALMILAGIGGILTSWNAFIIGNRQAIRSGGFNQFG